MKKEVMLILVILIIILLSTSVLAKCYREGEIFELKGECCKGLTKVNQETESIYGCMLPSLSDCYVCINKNDNICGKGENRCNCPEDCGKIKESEWKEVEFTLTTGETIDWKDKTKLKLKNVKKGGTAVITTDNINNEELKIGETQEIGNLKIKNIKTNYHNQKIRRTATFNVKNKKHSELVSGIVSKLSEAAEQGKQKLINAPETDDDKKSIEAGKEPKNQIEIPEGYELECDKTSELGEFIDFTIVIDDNAPESDIEMAKILSEQLNPKNPIKIKSASEIRNLNQNLILIGNNYKKINGKIIDENIEIIIKGNKINLIIPRKTELNIKEITKALSKYSRKTEDGESCRLVPKDKDKKFKNYIKKILKPKIMGWLKKIFYSP